MNASEVGQKVSLTTVYGAAYLKRRGIPESRREQTRKGVVIEVGSGENEGRSRVQWMKEDGSNADRTWMKTSLLSKA